MKNLLRLLAGSALIASALANPLLGVSGSETPTRPSDSKTPISVPDGSTGTTTTTSTSGSDLGLQNTGSDAGGSSFLETPIQFK